jgi:hypothetical protein
VAADLDNRHGRVINEGNVADPLALYLVLKFFVDLCEDRLWQMKVRLMMMLKATSCPDSALIVIL